MNTHADLRASERVPISTGVQVESKGRKAIHALAINISMGGLLLAAAPPLPVGSPCRVAIESTSAEAGKQIVLEGTVVRADAKGTAVKFATPLEQGTYEALARPIFASGQTSLFGLYSAYFKVSQNKNYENCEQLLGVSPSTFRKVFLSTFCACIPLAIAPVVIFKGDFVAAPAWLKIAASFGYAGVWFAVIQPSLDLTVLRFLKTKI